MAFLYFFLGLISLLPSNKSQMIDFCELRGAVYIEREERNMATFSVYQTDSEAFAQMLVFKEDSRTYADRPGLWYIVENRGMADFIIYMEKEEGMADFSIYFTETASFAGCK